MFGSGVGDSVPLPSDSDRQLSSRVCPYGLWFLL